MEYSSAVKRMFTTRREKKAKNNVQRLMQMPKGWILLKKDGTIIQNRTEEEIADDERYIEYWRLYDLYKKSNERILSQLRLDLLCKNYSEEEIDYYIEELYKEEEEEEEEENEEEEYYDSNEDEYSD
tara:strand:- start:8467 stop:8847 length:381 start_codon:yes stop_codon:yes gene_type:complete